jgi:hypothetical protein
MTVELRTREDLVDTLHLAAELEHNLLCQYLFAAYSIKRSTAEGLDEVQLETARGWESLITLVARQEMEHMGLALNLLAAIGATPKITRPNFPQPVTYYGALGIESVLTRFEPDTIRRFMEFESPHPAPDPDFCRQAGVSREEVVRLLLAAPPPTATYGDLPPGEIPFTSVQDLYQSLAAGFTYVAGDIGEQALFCGDFSAEIWGGPTSPYSETMDDFENYGLDVTPQVVDLATAHVAIAKILEQGEGIQAPPSYVEHVHYCIYADMFTAMGGFDAARPVVPNPLVSLHPDITDPGMANLISDEDTRGVAEAFNLSYELMLMLMLYLYGSTKKTQAQSTALMNAIFFPLMTMFVRPLAEVLTQLPAFTDRDGNAGPGFELSGELTLPADEDTWAELQAYFDTIADRLANLTIYDARPPGDPIVERLHYIAANMRRLATDWRDNWTNVGRDQ